MKNNVPETIFACIDEDTNQLDSNLWNKEEIKEYENELEFVEYVRKDLYDILLKNYIELQEKHYGTKSISCPHLPYKKDYICVLCGDIVKADK